MSKYTYQTKGNGFTIEIFKDGKSIYFAQDKAASEIVSKLEKAKVEKTKQSILGQYDYTV